MAQSGLRVLPVVSRTNLRKLEGTISLQDILSAYGSEPGQSPPATTRPAALLGGVIAVLVVILALAGFLSYFYRAERSAQAQRHFQQGNTLMEANRYPEAIEQYRSALSSSHSSEHRLALALALVKAEDWNEAEIYLRELVRSNPTSGPADLGLARVEVHQGNLQQAVNYYHRAIYGTWPAHSQENRVQARLELVETLRKFGEKKQAQAELLALMAVVPGDAAVRKRAAHLLLDLGLPKEALEAFREILQSDKQDAEAYSGLGEAELALGDYRSAQRAFRSAIRRNPSDQASEKGLQVAEQVLSLDPTLRGLSAAERYHRSQTLIEAVLGELDHCLASRDSPPPPSVGELLTAARKSLLSGRPPSYSDAAENNIALAGRLWETHAKLCSPPGPSGEPLARVMVRLSNR